MNKEIRYIKNAEINKSRWDETVSNAPNGFVYCKSVYLDALSSWDALVMGDYEYVMPLPFKSKWGFRYIYTPYFIGQLGVISAHIISAETVNRFLQTIPLSFKYIDMHLNEGNPVPEMPGILKSLRNNYVLPLKDPYHVLESRFSKDGKKNLRQANEFGLRVVENIDPSLAVQFFRNAYAGLNPGIKDEEYDRLSNAGTNAVKMGVGFTLGLQTSDGEIVTTAFFGKDDKRIYYMAGAPNKKGRQMNAQHVLINEVIKKYAGSNYSLDFEGSDIPAVATFYKKFSPELKTYAHIKINRLPLWAKWFKK